MAYNRDYRSDGYDYPRSDGYIYLGSDGFINHSGLEFSDISSELYRVYEFENGRTIRIDEPLKLNISNGGGHRLYDSNGISHYIPKGWIHLYWKSKPGQANFVR